MLGKLLWSDRRCSRLSCVEDRRLEPGLYQDVRSDLKTEIGTNDSDWNGALRLDLNSEMGPDSSDLTPDWPRGRPWTWGLWRSRTLGLLQ